MSTDTATAKAAKEAEAKAAKEDQPETLVIKVKDVRSGQSKILEEITAARPSSVEVISEEKIQHGGKAKLIAMLKERGVLPATFIVRN